MSSKESLATVHAPVHTVGMPAETRLVTHDPAGVPPHHRGRGLLNVEKVTWELFPKHTRSGPRLSTCLIEDPSRA